MDLKKSLTKMDIILKNRQMKKNEFLSAGEAARALGVSVKTIQRWDKAG
jgi:DNA-binding transcriptional regulator YiaG